MSAVGETKRILSDLIEVLEPIDEPWSKSALGRLSAWRDFPGERLSAASEASLAVCQELEPRCATDETLAGAVDHMIAICRVVLGR